MRNKHCRVTGKRSLQTTYTNMTRKQPINVLLTIHVNCLNKQSGFSIAPAAQYYSVARERVKIYSIAHLITRDHCRKKGPYCTYKFQYKLNACVEMYA